MMHGILYSAFIVSLLDAVTTYILIVTGRGVEANPFLQFLNHIPHAVFFVQILVVFGLALLLKIFEILVAALPTPLKMRIYKAGAAALITAVACRVAVVINNTLGILIGVTPLVDVLYA
jgi:hypothetical protein